MKNFTYLDELINNSAGEVILDSDIILDDEEESKYSAGIKLDFNELIIDGNGHKIDARGKTSIFLVICDNITIKNISLVNAYASFSGGAISASEGNVELINVNFENNVSDFSGGAVESMARLTISDSRFSNNSSDEGGAIKCDFATEIKNCRFEDNSAERGGAIYCYSGLNIEKSYFYKNVSRDGGGAIYNAESDITIVRSNFVENGSKDSEGGAVMNYGLLRVEDTGFYSNDAGNGGAISNYGNLIIFNSLFRDNHAFSIGAILNQADACIHKSAFKDNSDDFEEKSVMNTGAMKLLKCEFGRHQNYELSSTQYNMLTFEECNFRVVGLNFKYFDINRLEAVNAEEFDFTYLDRLIHGGDREVVLESDIILNSNEISDFKRGIVVDVDNLVIDGNGHTIDAKNDVRIFKIDAKNVTIKNVTLKNAYNVLGGAVVNGYGSELKICNVSFIDNNVDLDGAALVNLGSLKIVKSKFEGNYAKNSGGAIMCMSQMDICCCEFKNNESKIGGVVVISQFKGIKTKVNITDSKFMANRSGGSVMGFYTDMTSKNHFMEYDRNLSEITMADCEFRDNSTQKGVIFNENLLQIKDSLFSNNFVGTQKGGILVNNAGEMKIYNCCITDNPDARDGVITCFKGIVKILNSKCINNESFDHIIFNEDCLQISDTIFENNSASYMLLNGSVFKPNFESYNNIFSKNEVGCALIKNTNFAYFYNTILEDNICERDYDIVNSAIMRVDNLKMNDSKGICNKGRVSIGDSQTDLKIHCGGDIQRKTIPEEHEFDFSHLDELIHGGNSKRITLSNDITLADYESEFYEGGIELDIDGLVIDGNNMTIDGANLSRIFMVSADNVKLKNIIFKNGVSFKSYDGKFNAIGGAIKNNFLSNLTIENCKFVNNFAEYGGGIGNHGNIKIIDCEFIDNSSKVFGGAIYDDNGDVEIINSKMNHNHSIGGGSAIFSINANVSVTGCEFDYNTEDNGDGFHDRGNYPGYYNSVLYHNWDGESYGGNGKIQFMGCKFRGDNKNAVHYIGKTDFKMDGCEFEGDEFKGIFISEEKIYLASTKHIEETVMGGFLQYL